MTISPAWTFDATDSPRVSESADEKTSAAHSLETLREEFTGGRKYLSACTLGLPTVSTRAAVITELEQSASGKPDTAAYCESVERSRESFAQLVRVPATRVAIGSQVSVLVGLLATGVPEGGEVLVPDGDFSSLLLPFTHAGRGIRVRSVPLSELADSVSAETSMVAFSLVQSATGEVADAEAIVAAANRYHVRTVCDATQAVGWLPVDGTMFDALICHTYKWLCSPRGVAFLALSDALAAELTPVFASWYGGENPWASCYGTAITEAPQARRFDVSPAWQAFIGAEPALAAFAKADAIEIYEYTTGLAAEFRAALGIPAPIMPSAIVTWEDPSGDQLSLLQDAGIIASGRAGRARVAFHVFNDREDVGLAVAALRNRQAA